MRDYDKLTNAQKRIVDEVNAKLSKRLEQHGFKVGYHNQLGGGTSLVLHSMTRHHTEVLKGIMNSVDGVEQFITIYDRGHRQATREVTAANEDALRKLMGVRVREDGTLYVNLNDNTFPDLDD